MVPKITTGSSIRASLEYDQASKNDEPGGEWIAGSLSGSARAMAKQAALFRQLRPDCKKAIWSVSLSLPPADGRQTREKWAQITHSFFKKMGIDPDKYAWAAHRHTHQNDHIHIRICRISADGTLWNQEHSARRAIKACSELEAEFELNKHDRTPAAKNRPTRAEIEISSRKGKPMSLEKIQQAVDRILANHPVGIDFDLYQSYLKAEKIGVLPYAPGGQFKGVSYEFEGLKWPGSKIGREYSAGLPERGVRYGSEAKAQAEAAVLEAEKPAVKHADDDRTRARERAPAMIRNSLQPRADLDLPKTTTNIQRADIGPLSKVMLLIGAAAFKLSAAALAAMINFIRALLRRFGLMLTAAAPGSAQAQTALPFEPRYLDVESRFVPEPVTPNEIENAANELMKVADALERSDPNLLPPGQGRDELAAALVAEQSPFSIPPSNVKTVEIQGSAENKPGGLDELFSAPQEVVQPTPAQLVDDTLAALDRAVKAQAEAESRADDAPRVEADEVIEAKQHLAAAEKNLTVRKDRHYFEKAEAPKLLKFAFPSVDSFSAKEIAAVAAAKASLAAAEKAHPARVPEALNVALLQARIGSVRAAEVAVNKQKKLLATLESGNVELFKVAKSRIDSFAAQVKLLGHHPSTFQAQISLKSGHDAISSIAEKRIELEAEARLEVQKALEASSQKHIPRNNSSDDAPGWST